MVRSGDVPRALAARGYMGSGTFDVVVRSEEGAPSPETIAARALVRDGVLDAF